MPFVLANILQPLIDAFDAVLVFFHDQGGIGWGFSIILLTVCVRIVLIPLTLKQFKSMQAMQRLAPEIKALQEKYKDDKQRQQQEMMAFYREHQVNPFGSCLPLVLQMPVFFSLFYMLRKDLKVDICTQKLIDIGAIGAGPTHPVLDSDKLGSIACNTSDAGFLFIPDITTKATGAVLVGLIVLYIGSQLASSLLMSVSADRNQRLLMMGLPFLFVTFIVNFPAGLIVYWITTNLWTVGQQYFVRKVMGPMHPLKPAAAGAPALTDGKGAKPKGGGAAKPKGAAAKTEEAPERRREAPPPPPRRKKKRSGRRR